jgi:ATP-dependent Lon protease
MACALYSLAKNQPIIKNVAMTGEITLRGEVLPIGGLKEKLLAAHRGGIKTVIIPHENERDLVEIPKNIKENLEIKPVRWIDEVLDIALTSMPVSKSAPGKNAGKTKSASGATDDDAASKDLTHH